MFVAARQNDNAGGSIYQETAVNHLRRPAFDFKLFRCKDVLVNTYSETTKDKEKWMRKRTECGLTRSNT